MTGSDDPPERPFRDTVRGDVALLVVAIVLVGGALVLSGGGTFETSHVVALVLVCLATAAILVLGGRSG